MVQFTICTISQLVSWSSERKSNMNKMYSKNISVLDKNLTRTKNDKSLLRFLAVAVVLVTKLNTGKSVNYENF